MRCGDYTVRALLKHRDRAVSGFYPFSFYLEPVVSERRSRPVPHLVDVVTDIVPAAFDGARDHTVSPFVDWTTVDSWEQFLATRRSLPGVDSVATVLKKRERLERELGPISLQLVDDSPDLLDTLVKWKSEQFERTGRMNRLSIKQNVDFYRELRNRGFFVTTSFRAGDVLLGGKIGVRMQGRHISRVTVFNREYADHSPGSVMSLDVLRASFDAGDREFDYLVGREPYKFTYATHMRVLSNVGREPRLDWAMREARGVAGRAWHGRRGYAAYKEVTRRAGTLARRVGRR